MTATLAAGFEWGQLSDGWTATGPTTATLMVMFAEVERTPLVPVAPVAPMVMQATCANGEVTAPGR